jgi:hypothetical protein
MRIDQSNEPSIIKFTKNLGEILLLCDTGITLPDDCPPIYIARPEINMNVYPILLDYFDLNPLLCEPKPFSFFVGRKLILREIRGYDNVIQLVDKHYNMLELKMKPDINDVLRRKKLLRIKKCMIAKANSTKRSVTK